MLYCNKYHAVYYFIKVYSFTYINCAQVHSTFISSSRDYCDENFFVPEDKPITCTCVSKKFSEQEFNKHTVYIYTHIFSCIIIIAKINQMHNKNIAVLTSICLELKELLRIAHHIKLVIPV